MHRCSEKAAGAEVERTKGMSVVVILGCEARRVHEVPEGYSRPVIEGSFTTQGLPLLKENLITNCIFNFAVIDIVHLGRWMPYSNGLFSVNTLQDYSS